MESAMVTLEQVLRFRERKAQIAQMFRNPHRDDGAAGDVNERANGGVAGDANERADGGVNGCVVSFGMNIPGPVKTGPSVRQAFLEGKRLLEDTFQKSHGIVRYEAALDEPAGYAAVYRVEGICAKSLKIQAMELEETHMLGRLFDIDVSDENGIWITRESVGGGARKCLLCGRNARVCGRSRTHTADELYGKVMEITDSWRIGKMAHRALMEEVYTTPKPGLVDRYSPGAHSDMDINTFQKSADALLPYFVRMASSGMRSPESPEALFMNLRKTGILAEQAMKRATNGINTHRGAIFTLGILCGAAGRCIRENGTVERQALIDMELLMVRRVLMEEIKIIREKGTARDNKWRREAAPDSGWEDVAAGENVAAGEKNLQTYGIAGIRGEAANGYPSVTGTGIPVLLDGIRAGKEWNLVKLQTLLSLMSTVEDSNIIARHNPGALSKVQEDAKRFLRSGGAYAPDAIQKLREMDREYTERNISAGGCADLLAASIFICGISGEIR